MAHMILGERFVHRNAPGWHNIAKKKYAVDEKITASEAMAEVAGDVIIGRYPLSYTVQENGVDVRKESKSVMIARAPLPDDPKWVELGVTSENWVAASYKQLATALDPLSEKYPVETAGLLKEGGLAFLCFRAPDWSVKGDAMRSYFAANFSLTPGKGHRIFHSPVRVECWNTNTLAEGQASINLPIAHTPDALQKIKLASDLVVQFQGMQDKTKEIFEAFADYHVTAKEAEAIFRAAFPEPKLPAKLRLLKETLTATESETFKAQLTPDLLIGIVNEEEAFDRKRLNVQALMDASLERYEVFEPAAMRGTAWAAYNAVTEVSDWREGRGADASLLIGGRAQEKARAYAAAATLMKS